VKSMPMAMRPFGKREVKEYPIVRKRRRGPGGTGRRALTRAPALA